MAFVGARSCFEAFCPRPQLEQIQKTHHRAYTHHFAARISRLSLAPELNTLMFNSATIGV